MKWTYSIGNKGVASGALLSLCLLVMLSIHINHDHAKDFRNSISTLYRDRLVAETYILKITSDIYQIREILDEPEQNRDKTENRIENLLLDIRNASNAYLSTKLTDNEGVKSVELLRIVDKFASGHSKGVDIESKNTNKALALLNELSVIQLEESKLIMKQAESLFIAGKASTQFAFAVTIIILLVLLSVVFASKTLSSGNQTSAQYLN